MNVNRFAIITVYTVNTNIITNFLYINVADNIRQLDATRVIYIIYIYTYILYEKEKNFYNFQNDYNPSFHTFDSFSRELSSFCRKIGRLRYFNIFFPGKSRVLR